MLSHLSDYGVCAHMHVDVLRDGNKDITSARVCATFYGVSLYIPAVL